VDALGLSHTLEVHAEDLRGRPMMAVVIGGRRRLTFNVENMGERIVDYYLTSSSCFLTIPPGCESRYLPYTVQAYCTVHSHQSRKMLDIIILSFFVCS